MREVEVRTKYVMCPHTAVAYLGLKAYEKTVGIPVSGIFFSTAHYAKFLDVVEETLETKVPVPTRLSDLLEKEKVSIKISDTFEDFKKYLLSL